MSIPRQSCLVRLSSLDGGQVLVVEAQMPFSVVDTLKSVISSSLVTVSRGSFDGNLTKHTHASSALGSLLRQSDDSSFPGEADVLL